MSIEVFRRVSGTAAPMLRANISTDAIIPATWAIRSDIDLGTKLFGNERYDEDGSERADFVLNEPPFRKAKILLAGSNFGCGSSRESAVWALQKFGIRCVIAPSFGEIFRENMFKNGLLPIELDQALIAKLHEHCGGDRALTVDVESQAIVLPDGSEIPFEISQGRRRALLLGLDDLGQIRAEDSRIDQFELSDRIARPWAWAIGEAGVNG